MTEERITLTVNLAIPAEFPHAMFTAAIEGGINYWAEVFRYRWSKGGPDHEADFDGFHAVIAETEGGENHRIDREVILRGLGRLFAGEYAGLHTSSAARIMSAALGGDAGTLDAGDADALVQVGLFGEVVFG